MRASFLGLLVLVAQLIAGPASGQAKKAGWLGANIQDLTLVEAGTLGWMTPRGTKVTRPVKGSPAEVAGIEPGDVIAALDGVDVQNGHAFTEALRAKGAGTVVRVRLLRHGREMTIPVVLDVLPEELAVMEQALQLGRNRKFGEGFALARQALALAEKRVGPEHESVADLALRVAQFHDALRDPDGAEPLYKRALAIREKALGPGHPDVARVLNGLAVSYERARRYAESEALYQRSLALLEKGAQPDNVLIASTLAGLAHLYQTQDTPAKAEPLRQRALALMENTLGPEHPEVAGFIGNLAFSHLRAGRYADSEALYKRALAILEKAAQPDDFLLGKALADLGYLYQRQKLNAKAEPLFQRSLALIEGARGPDHPDVRGALERLAEFYEAKGSPDAALPLRERALAITQKAPGADQIGLYASVRDLAYNNLGQDRYEEATQLFERALAIREKALGLDSPKLYNAISDLARAYEQQRRYDDAERLHQRQLAIMEKAHGPDDLALTRQLNVMAAFYTQRRRYDLAERLYQRSLAIVEKAQGQDHEDYGYQLNQLLDFYRSQHRYAEVEQTYLRRLEAMEKEHGPDHPGLRDVLDRLGGMYEIYLSRSDKAEPIYRRSLAIMEKAHGADHLNVRAPLRQLAELLERQNRYKEAEPLLARILAITEKARGPDHPSLAGLDTGLGEGVSASPLETLARNYEWQGRYDEAEKLYLRRLAIVEQTRGLTHVDVGQALKQVTKFYGDRARAMADEQRGRDKTEEHKKRAKAEQLRLLAKVEPLLKRALAINEKMFGPDEPELGDELRDLADFYGDQKRYAEAAPLLRRWLSIIEKTRGPDHQDLRSPLSWLAMLYEQQDEYVEALSFRERWLAIAKKGRDSDRGNVSSAVDDVASLYRKLGQLDKAEALRKDYLAELEKAEPPDHEGLRRPLGDLAFFYEMQHRYAEAEPLRKRGLEIAEKTSGPDDYGTQRAIDDLASLYMRLGRFAEAEPLYKRALAQADKESGGNDSSGVRNALESLLEAYRGQGRYADAVPLARRMLAKAERDYASGEDSSGWTVTNVRTDVVRLLREANLAAEAEDIARRALASAKSDYVKANALLDLGALFRGTMRLGEAETFYRRGLEAAEASDRRFDSSDITGPTVRAQNDLALLLQETNRLAEAEALFQELQPAAENVKDDIGFFAGVFGNYAVLLEQTGRLDQALELSRRALAITEKIHGPAHPRVGEALNNLAGYLWRAGRIGEAEPLARRSLAIYANVYGPDDHHLASPLNTLALILERAKRVSEAEPLLRRAIAIEEKAYGPDDQSLATELSNLSLMTYRTGQVDEAEALMRRAMFINKNVYGPAHPAVAVNLFHLAIMRAGQGDWVQAAALQARAKPALLADGGAAAGDRPDLTKVILKQHSISLRSQAIALNHADPGKAAARAEAFELAQWALQTDAADALTQMSARFAKGNGPLASLVRERQALVAQRQAEDKRMLEAISQANPQALKGVYASRDGSKRRLESLDAELAAKFPEYARLAAPKPLSFAETQALLKGDEALVLIIDVPRLLRLPEEALVWVVTKTKVAWHSVPLGTGALADNVVALRCGLDAALWERDETVERCRAALKGSGYEAYDARTSSVLPFDIARAHALYMALLGPVQALVKDKHLLVVASGPLTSLPFGVLVTEAPEAATPASLSDYRQAAWLGTRQPVSALPSVASLTALRRHARASQATDPYVGFGDPALAGNGMCGPMSAMPDRCPDEAVQIARGTPVMTRSVQSLSGPGSYFRGGLANVDALRSACPLPDTAYELRCVARSLGAAQGAVVIGNEMTETAVKAAPLDRYRIVHFATHGLLAGETALFARDRAEPALLMSPPETATEADDGLLTASEVAGLKLDADWVILSACNTAGGQEPGAEALSGLARAFFYAGARALLVSHWYVNSDTATLLTSRTFAEMRASARIGRAEAFRRAMLATMSDAARPRDAHPSAWAPFVVVGEGGQPLAARTSR